MRYLKNLILITFSLVYIMAMSYGIYRLYKLSKLMLWGRFCELLCNFFDIQSVTKLNIVIIMLSAWFLILIGLWFANGMEEMNRHDVWHDNQKGGISG